MRKFKTMLLSAGIAAVLALGGAVGAHLATNDAPLRTEAAAATTLNSTFGTNGNYGDKGWTFSGTACTKADKKDLAYMVKGGKLYNKIVPDDQKLATPITIKTSIGRFGNGSGNMKYSFGLSNSPKIDPSSTVLYDCAVGNEGTEQTITLPATSSIDDKYLIVEAINVSHEYAELYYINLSYSLESVGPTLTTFEWNTPIPETIEVNQTIDVSVNCVVVGTEDQTKMGYYYESLSDPETPAVAELSEGPDYKLTGKNIGTYVLTATANFDKKTTLEKTIKVVSETPKTVTDVVVSGQNSLIIGNETQLTAKVNGTGTALSQDVTWSVESGNSVTITNKGLVKAVNVGKSVVKATSTYDNTKSGTFEINVADIPMTYTITPTGKDAGWNTPFDDALFKNKEFITGAENFTFVSGTGLHVGQTNKQIPGANEYIQGTPNSKLTFEFNDQNNIIKKVSLTARGHNSKTANLTLNGETAKIKSGSSDKILTAYVFGNQVSIELSNNCYFKDITVELVKKSDLVNAYGEAFLDLTNGECGNVGTAKEGVSKATWDKLAALFNNLDETTKLDVKKVIPNQTGTDIEQAMYRYNLILQKYGTKNQLDDFMELGIHSAPVFNGIENNVALIVIISVSVLAISAIAIFAITRRKKLAK